MTGRIGIEITLQCRWQWNNHNQRFSKIWYIMGPWRGLA